MVELIGEAVIIFFIEMMIGAMLTLIFSEKK